MSLIGLATVLLFGLFVVGCIAVAATSSDDDPLGVADSCDQIVYELEGTAAAVTVTMNRPTGMEQLNAVTLPWSFDAGCYGTFDTPLLYAQNTGDAGDITCRIKRNGVVTAQATSSGAFVIAQCNESP